MLKKNTNIKLSEALETFAVCFKQKRLVSQRFKQTCVIAYLYIYFLPKQHTAITKCYHMLQKNVFKEVFLIHI